MNNGFVVFRRRRSRFYLEYQISISFRSSYIYLIPTQSYFDVQGTPKPFLLVQSCFAQRLHMIMEDIGRKPILFAFRLNILAAAS
ncbi:hypothetical protein D3H35_03860 [Cohnella faecalis]|uniref:Uncharacterized protein n=1 Tax=Cohnella faecalis TaxID=2315694 RepID=A0A398CXW5_9BACL|nr:hypothetical protein D3H35_03860 [Cohnella faecalis]